MPCCGAPRPDINLVFTRFDGTSGDPFNASRYREARPRFAAGSPAVDEISAATASHCTKCEWDQILRYFRAADASFFDRRSLRILSDW